METLEVPVTQPLAVIKGDLAAITAQLEQWRGVEQDPPVWAGYRNHHRGLSARYSAAYSGADGGSAGGVLLVRRSREQREKYCSTPSGRRSVN